MKGSQWIQRLVRMTGAMALLMPVLVGPSGAQAQSTFSLFDPEPDGIHLTISALADITTPGDNRMLFLEEMEIGSCAVGEGFHDEGPLLMFVESYRVTVRYDSGNGPVETALEQGDSVLIPAGTDFTLINDMSDPAFAAEVVMLAVTKAKPGSTSAAPIEPVVKLAKSFTDWPKESYCDAVSEHAVLQATFKVRGWAGTNATQLYLGIGVWDPGASTDGYSIASEQGSFNILLLSGGMPTAGPTTGRAVYNGPRRVLSDTYGDQLMGAPFENPGSAPVVGWIFGTTSDSQPVFAPAEGA